MVSAAGGMSSGDGVQGIVMVAHHCAALGPECVFFLDIGLLRLYVALQQMLHRSMIDTGEFQ
jgi:hypothetical protein